MLTFRTAELVATKIRALYQRSKGRDLFDLWVALVELQIDADDILEAFTPYQPGGLTSKKAITNLQAKVADNGFRTDIEPLVTAMPTGYAVDTAAELIIDRLLVHLD